MSEGMAAGLGVLSGAFISRAAWYVVWERDPAIAVVDPGRVLAFAEGYSVVVSGKQWT